MPRTHHRRLSVLTPVGLLAAVGLAIAPVPSSGSGTSPTAAAGGGAPRTLLVLDSSGSMAEPAGGGTTKIAAARRALTEVVRGLPEDAEVGLRVFGAEVFSRTDAGACEDTQLVVEPGTGNRDALLSAIDDYRPFGETPIPAALRAAAEDLGDEGPRSVVLVSDGESTCDPDPCTVAAELRERGVDLRIDVVGLSVSGAAREQLACIAERGGGTYYDADDADDVVATIDYVASRAARPFVVTGTPVEGGTADAPAPLTVGDWTDVLGAEGSTTGERWYAVERTVEGSTLRLSAVIGGNDRDGLQIEVLDPAGDRCAISVVNRLVDAGELVGGQVVVEPEEECAAPGTYLLRLERRLGDEPQLPVGIRVAEEPPVTDLGTPASSAEGDVSPVRVTGPVTEVVGARTFDGAPELSTGRWRTTIVPGDAALLAVPLAFGQALRVQADVPAVPDHPVIGSLMRVTLVNPMRAELAQPGAAVVSAAVGPEPTTFRVATPPVSRELLDTEGVSTVEDWSMAGDHYVVLSMRADRSGESTFEEYDVRLSVEVVGEPAPGPTYADGATWSVAEGASYPEPADAATDDADAAADDAPAEAPTDDPTEGGNGLVLMGIGAGIGLLLLLGVVVAARRRGPVER